MKKKILILINNLKIGGGAERVAASLTNRLSEQYDVFILTFNDFKNLYPFKGQYYSLQENLDPSSKIFNFFKLYNILRLIRIYKFISSISPNIIISFMDNTNIFTIFTKFLFRIKIPLILTVQTNPKMAYKKKMQYLNFLIKTLYPLKIVDKIIIISKELQFILENDYGIKKNKLKTIYNGIELKKIKEMKEDKILEYKEIFHNESLIKFITVGRLIEIKGHKYLIEAFSKVKTEIPNSKLIIRGDGPFRIELEMFIRKKRLENDIIFLELKKNIFKYLAKSDIFILSSKYEGFPTVLLEALACGLPIISTNCKTGPKEILDNGKYGLLVKVMDSKDLAEKMIFLAKNKELMKKYSIMSLKRAKFFDLEKILKEWIIFIESYLYQ